LVASGLGDPMGLDVDQAQGVLFVADPLSRKIWKFALSASGNTLSAGPAAIAADHTEARWVACDGLGNIFFSDEPSNQILKISAGNLKKGITSPEVVYDGASVAEVSAPGGVAVDNFFVYWVNKNEGLTKGSLVKAAERPENGASATSVAQALSTNTARSYGLCMAMGNVFYTQPEGIVFGVKKDGGDVAQVVTTLQYPRGCAWDGDGTMYVADRGANAIYSFAGNMAILGASEITKAVDFEDAFGVAVYSSSAPRRPGSASWLIVSPVVLCFAALFAAASSH